MRKSACLILAVVLTVLFCAGCNAATDSDLQNASSAQSKEPTKESETRAIEQSNNQSKPYYYDEIRDFSDGLAWVTCGEDDKNKNNLYWGCIDKTGKLLFQYKNRNIDIKKDFSNGYSYISEEQKIYVIDKSGNICSSYETMEKRPNTNKHIFEDNREYIAAYGDGYVVTQNHKTDFDNAYFLYTIYDAKGNVFDTYKTNNDGEIGVNYCGKGIFAFADDYETKSFFFDEVYYKTNFYFCKSKQWVKTEYGDTNSAYFYDDTAVLDIVYSDGSDGYRADLVLMDTNGSISKVHLTSEYGDVFQTIGIINNICFIYDVDTSLVTYDLKTEKLSQLTNKTYLEKINWGYFDNEDKSKLCFSDNIIALPLIGKDDEKYVAVFDKDWNTVLEPFKHTGVPAVKEGIFIIDGTVYDSSGKGKFNIRDKGYSLISDYSDGAACVVRESVAEKSSGGIITDNDFTFINTEGEALFNKIDTSDVDIKNLV